jgi:hypothetical protein
MASATKKCNEPRLGIREIHSEASEALPSPSPPGGHHLRGIKEKSNQNPAVTSKTTHWGSKARANFMVNVLTEWQFHVFFS